MVGELGTISGLEFGREKQRIREDAQATDSGRNLTDSGKD